jgi:transposase-like protein
MQIFVGVNGLYTMPDIVKDFRNAKAIRRYKRNLKKERRLLRKMSKSSLYMNLRDKPEACPKCGMTKLIRWGIYWRRIRYFFSRFTNKLPIQRYKCKHCRVTTSVLPKYITECRRYSDKALRDMVDMKLWTYAGYRKVGNWIRIHGSSHTTVIREIIKLGKVCSQALKAITCKFSGIVCIDEIFFRKIKGIHYMGIAAVDARYGRIILEETYFVKTPTVRKKFGDLVAENIFDTKTECIKQFIEEILKIVNPKVIITDDNASYSAVIDEINRRRKQCEKIKHFLCTLHIMWRINSYFQGHGRLKFEQKFEDMRKQLTEVFQAETFERANTLLDKALKRAYEFKGTCIEPLFQILSENKDRLFPYLRYGLNRTNNPVEHYFGFIKRFQHVSRKFTSLKGISSLLSVFALFYNFTPKMEGDNKGVTPLQKAGWNHKLDMYEFINYPKCISRVHA